MPFSFSSRQMTRSTSPQRPLSTSSAKPRAMPAISARLRIGRCSTLVLSDTRRRSAKVERPDGDRAAVSLAEVAQFVFELVNPVGQLQEFHSPIAFHHCPVNQAQRQFLAVLELQRVALARGIGTGEFKGVEDFMRMQFKSILGIH